MQRDPRDIQPPAIQPQKSMPEHWTLCNNCGKEFRYEIGWSFDVRLNCRQSKRVCVCGRCCPTLEAAMEYRSKLNAKSNPQAQPNN